jgi:hypothetical protein
VTTADRSGQSGITAQHTLAGIPGQTDSQPAAVQAIAHVHVHGQGVDFNAAGNPEVVDRDTFVDVSNDASAIGIGGPATYTAPVLSVGGISEGQNGSGSIRSQDLNGPGQTHLVTIRGHLLLVFPRAVVVTPGTEIVAGVIAGTSRTTTLSWTYNGGWTSAPVGEGTPPGSTGASGNAITLQWNNAEPLDSRGHPVDEQVPMTITAQTTYPDGHVATETISGSVPVTIYYVARGGGS